MNREERQCRHGTVIASEWVVFLRVSFQVCVRACVCMRVKRFKWPTKTDSHSNNHGHDQ